MPTYPNCQHTWSTPSNAAKVESLDRDTSGLSEVEVRAYYKRTAVRRAARSAAEHPRRLPTYRAQYERLIEDPKATWKSYWALRNAEDAERTAWPPESLEKRERQYWAFVAKVPSPNNYRRGALGISGVQHTAR